MQKELLRVIEQVSKEKGIDRQLVIEALEEAMKSAAKKTHGADLNIEAKFNVETSEIDIYKIETVVAEIENPDAEITLETAREKYDPESQIGDELLTKLGPPDSRIAAQAAKQNIVQKVRDYERAMIYNEFKQHEGTIQSGIVMRFERRNLIVQLRPNVDAILPEREQIPRERYRQGDRIRALIVRVDENARGPQIVLSRTNPELVKKLFEQEVPEVYEGIVEVKDVVREPGGRAKIAVVSHDSDVDPVGACVGMRGSRVQAVVQELRGERIDIVPWTPDETEFVCRALSPAKVSRIVIDEGDHSMEVVVPDDQLSLAIGRKGQNVRLAGKLTGWKLDVHSESEYERWQRESRRSLRRVEGLSDLRAELLLADGYKSAGELAGSDPDDIAGVLECTPEEAQRMITSAKGADEIERREKIVARIARAVAEAAEAVLARGREEAAGLAAAAEEAAEPAEATVEA
ncbi:MAG TPA: transcription termination factor NusA [Candidatus Binatia bacterium]|nr:transcription termination factor NusA [Candidatus Binatia bacterium]